jgi:hypothetical protein
MVSITSSADGVTLNFLVGRELRCFYCTEARFTRVGSDAASKRNKYQESGGKGRPARKADFTVICEPIASKMWEPWRLTVL